MHRLVYVGLGSNLQNPKAQLERAVRSLHNMPNVRDFRVSRFYQSKAVGPGPQPDYINAAAKFSTNIEPLQLLQFLQSIETSQERVRAERWGPRTLDLDILLYGDESLNWPQLVIPHPRIMERSFVLLPLMDLTPGLVFPCGTSLSTALEKVNQAGTFPINRE